MLFCQMCILCPIKVLLPTSHVFNRFMFSICEASSHLSRLVSFMFSQRKIDHMRILFSSRRIVSVPVRKVTHPRNVHFLDVLFWSHLIFRGMNGRKKGKCCKKLSRCRMTHSDEESVGTRSPPLLPEFFGILTAPKQTTLTPSNIPYLSPSRLTAPQQMLFHSSNYCSWLLGF